MENFVQPKDTDGILYKVVILILISLLLIAGGLVSFLVIKKETSSYSKFSAVVPSLISEEGGPLFEGQNFVQIVGFFEKVENGRLYLNVSNQEVYIVLPEEIFLFCNNDITVYEIDFTRLDTSYVSKDFYMSPQQISQEIEPFQQKVILLYKVMGKEISSELNGIVASFCKQTHRQ